MSTLLKRKHVLAAYATGAFSGAASYQSKVLGDGASNYWPLDETSGTVAKDIKGGANGTISGGVTLTGSEGMIFNGTTGKIPTISLAIPPSATIEAWIKTTSSGTQAFFSNRSTASAGLGSSVYSGTITSKSFFYSNVGTTFTGIKIIADNQWHYVVFVITTATTYGYIDGQLDNTSPSELRTANSYLASIGLDESNNEFWNGSIKDVAIYPTALSPSQILSHYQARSG